MTLTLTLIVWSQEKLRTLRVHRLNAMRTGQRDEHTAITKRSTKQREELVSMQRRERRAGHVATLTPPLTLTLTLILTLTLTLTLT